MTDKHVYPSASFGTGNDDKLCSFNEIKGLTKRELFALEIFKAKIVRFRTDRELIRECINLADQLLEELARDE